MYAVQSNETIRIYDSFAYRGSIKDMQDRFYDADDKCWVVPLTKENVATLGLLGATLDEALQALTADSTDTKGNAEPTIKPPIKVDRSGAYLARYIAKNVVASNLAEKCEVALSYAIGVPKPTSVDVNTFYTGTVSEVLIKKAIEKVFDLSVAGTIEKLDLKKPVYAQTAVGGHFGKDFLAWELVDKAEELNDAVSKG